MLLSAFLAFQCLKRLLLLSMHHPHLAQLLSTAQH